MAGEDAFGTQFLRDSTGAGAYVAIASVADGDGPNISRESIDTTTHDSPGGWREFVKGLKDGGDANITLNYSPRQLTHKALRADLEEKELRSYRIVFLPGDVDQESVTFKAMITDLGHAWPVDDKLEQDVTFKISGPPVWSNP
jgi:predicted secreted protein